MATLNSYLALPTLPAKQSFTASSNGQASYATAGYTPGQVNVFIGGVRLDPAEYTATDGINVVITNSDVLSQITTGVIVDVDNSYSAAQNGPISVSTITNSIQTSVLTPLASTTGSGLVGFLQSGSAAVARTTQSKLQDVVSITDFYSGNWTTALTTAAASGAAMVEIPSGLSITLATGTITLTSGVDLLIKGNLTGNNTQITIPGTCDIICEGGSLQDVGFLLTGGSPRLRGLRMAGYTLTAMIVIGQSGSTFQDLIIDDIYIQNANYGILRQGTGSTLVNAQITNGQFYNLTGDAIEWNVASGDTNINISNHVIDTINSSGTGTDQGIGIGFAGSSFDINYGDANLVKDFVISNIKGRSVRQLIHVECGKRFIISNIECYDISPNYSVNSGLSNYAVQIYGCTDFMITNVRGSYSAGISCAEGVVSGNYIAPCQNYTVSNCQFINPPSGATDVPNYFGMGNTGSVVGLRNIDVYGGYINIAEYPTELVIESIRAIRPKANGTAITWQFNLNTDGRQAFRAASPTSLTVKDCIAVDYNMAQSNTVTGVVQGIVRASGNNFDLLPSGVSAQQIQRTLFGNNGSSPPAGFEFLAGDLYVDQSGYRALFTVSGSLGKGSDNFTVVNSTTIESTNYAWTVSGNHDQGQRITLSNVGASGAALSTTVVSTYISAGHYYMTVADTITAVAGTTGSITPTVTPTYIALPTLTSGNIDINTAGSGLRVAEGSNAKQGTATLAAGTVTVFNTSVTATSRIFLTAQDNNTTGTVRVSARTAGTSFVITSSNSADTGVIAYEIFEQG
jgi:colanic acid biosynthesis protein WcaM